MGWREEIEKLKKDGVAIITSHRNLDRAIFTKDLSTGALLFTSVISDKWKIEQVMVCARNGAGAFLGLSATSIVVTFDSISGQNYDVVIGAESFDGDSNIGLISGSNLLGVVGESGDEINIVSEGSDTVGILYGTIIYEILT